MIGDDSKCLPEFLLRWYLGPAFFSQVAPECLNPLVQFFYGASSHTGGNNATATFHIYDGTNAEEDDTLGHADFSSFGIADVGKNFLTLFSIGWLGPGDYLFNFWHDNSVNPTVQFDMVFSTTSDNTVVPEPGSITLFFGMRVLAMLGYGRKRLLSKRPSH